jgi:hypothetical protein
MSNILDFISVYGLFLGIPLAFLGLVLWIYRPTAALRYRDDARIPFLDGKKRPSSGRHARHRHHRYSLLN